MPSPVQKRAAVVELCLADLLVARLCHDISGAVMAVLAAAAAPANTADTASAASDVLLQRLRLYRTAWSDTGDSLAVADLPELGKGMPRGAKIRIETGGLDAAGSFTPACARVVLNVLILAAESLPAGGVITLAGDTSSGLVIRIDGPKAGWPAGLGAMLAEPTLAQQEISMAGAEPPRGLIGAITALIAAALGVRITPLMAARTEDAPPLALDLTRHT